MELSEEFRQLQESYHQLSMLKPSSLPEIELYMDQLTTIMEEKLQDQRRYPEDKILTRTMINNYTKNRLLPPPVNKKYSQDHLLTLLYTYYMKNIISIRDITTLLEPMTRMYWDNYRKDNDSVSMKEIYEYILSLAPELHQSFREDIDRKIDTAEHAFPEFSGTPEELDYLRRFTLCVLLAFDVYLKKKMIERIVDDMREEAEAAAAQAEKAAKKDKKDRKDKKTR